ncbi:unnamed protein product [Hyaloperonospora brassicae]|uniref:Palmitoyltransferase n=1 Tax=Hyaloperonospora brassicae TaxID=162125 RepID=A0AAV0T5X9_HYABA|nr:unnamed protein product [Hyaloperonospora brassicae]
MSCSSSYCCDGPVLKVARYVLPGVILSIILYLYWSFVLFAQSRILASGASHAEVLLFHYFVGLLSWSFAQTLRSQRSFLPRRTLSTTQREALTTSVVPQTARSDAFIEVKANGAARVCRKCRAGKPDRTHHCSTCRRCVLKMDHHCIFLNKCIGYDNYKFFVQFLGWSAATCLYQSSLLYRYVLATSLGRAATLYVFGKLGLLSPHLQIVSVFVGSACLGLALACFYMVHLYFVANNYSTLEYCEKRTDPEYVNYFNMGIVRNFQEVFGTFREFPYWFVPVHSPSFLKRDGKSFPLNRKLVKVD